MTDLSPEGRESLRKTAATLPGLHDHFCDDKRSGDGNCSCGLDAIREAVPALLDRLAVMEAAVHELEGMVSHADSERNKADILRQNVAADNAALRAALESAVAHCCRGAPAPKLRVPTREVWSCPVCGPWRKVLEGKLP